MTRFQSAAYAVLSILCSEAHSSMITEDQRGELQAQAAGTDFSKDARKLLRERVLDPPPNINPPGLFDKDKDGKYYGYIAVEYQISITSFLFIFSFIMQR